ncbi:TIM-barrel domain-containing protein [Streptomyces sp. enrichment culture]|uniref:TIM-barrel domain-containing protein n=1 Tax=Streptomyces sp. enrichment culture TaxID=1795815 RepID=UPI003F56603A
MSGVPWSDTDVGGDPDDPAYGELLIRCFRYGTFSPVVRLHADRDQLFLCERLRPYLRGLSEDAYRTGPIDPAAVPPLPRARASARHRVPVFVRQVHVADVLGCPPAATDTHKRATPADVRLGLLGPWIGRVSAGG